MSNVVVPNGGVSFESARGYRGSVTVNGVRRRTGYFKTRRAALKALTTLRSNILLQMTSKRPKSLSLGNTSRR